MSYIGSVETGLSVLPAQRAAGRFARYRLGSSTLHSRSRQLTLSVRQKKSVTQNRNLTRCGFCFGACDLNRGYINTKPAVAGCLA